MQRNYARTGHPNFVISFKNWILKLKIFIGFFVLHFILLAIVFLVSFESVSRYRYCPVRRIRPKVGSFDRSLLKEASRGLFRKIRPSPIEWEPYALTAPLALRHTRGYKRAMKKIIINAKLQNKHFLIVIYHSSLVKATMNAAPVCKMLNGVCKRPSMSSFFNCQRRNEYSPQLSKL